MAWLRSDRMNYRDAAGRLVPAGEPFEVKDRDEEKRLVRDRGFVKLTAAAAKRVLAGEPEEDEEE